MKNQPFCLNKIWLFTARTTYFLTAVSSLHIKPLVQIVVTVLTGHIVVMCVTVKAGRL